MSTPRPENATSREDDEVRRRVKAMRDDELIDFVRDTVAHLSALADRLEVFADERATDKTIERYEPADDRTVERGGDSRDA